MPYPGVHAKERPGHPAVIDAGSGDTVDYATLDARSNRIAQFLFDKGFRHGDTIAILMENNIRYFEIVWAALRSGLVVTPINRHFTVDEVAYIVNDCGAKALFTSTHMSKVANELADNVPNCRIRLVIDGVCDGYALMDTAMAAFPATALEEELRGRMMFYSSGTTGRPKGISRKPERVPISDGLANMQRMFNYGMGKDTVYLSPAPNYHAAPLGHSIGVLGIGGTVVMMPRFDAEKALRCIQDCKVTHSQWVPTMFIRMLKLPQAVRDRYDLSSHRLAIHAAAPCPTAVKRAMIDWWGPILHEYYSGSEGLGSTAISSDEWLERPGSVGRARQGVIHICGEDGKELPSGETGLIYFEQPEMPFVYHNDPDKTRDAQHPAHPNWATYGDVGYVDGEGYLYLTDRKSFMIISGGVNIYPRAVEDALVLHPKVMDAAVIGVPNEEFGEEVKAVVQLAPDLRGSEDVVAELLAFTREKVAGYMVPRSIDFTDEFPRLPTGKLYKRKLRDKYWAQDSAQQG